MSHLSKMLLFVCLIITSTSYVQAQVNQTKYLSGAVPEVEGKVVFSQTIPTKQSASEIYRLVQKWIAEKSADNDDFYKTRTLLADSTKHEMVLQVNDRLIFVKTAFNLDYALISYYLILKTYDNSCQVIVRNIRYQYVDNKELMTAETMIADAVALNKDQTKLLREHDKFRIATINMVEIIGEELDQYFNGSAYKAMKEAYKLQSNVSDPIHKIQQVPAPPMHIESNDKTNDSSTIVPVIPTTQPTVQKPKSKEVKRVEDILFEQISTKAFSFSNYFVVGESIAYVRQLSSVSVNEIDGRVAILGYLDNEGVILPQSFIMPSAKFYLFYCNPNNGQYYQLTELSKKFAEGKPYTDTDIALIEQIQSTSKPLFELDKLKINTVLTTDLDKNLSAKDYIQISNSIKTDSCVIISGEVVK